MDQEERWRQLRLKMTAAAVVLIGSAAVVAGCGTDRLALSQVPQGVSRQKLDDTPVIAVRHKRDVRLFIADAQHIEGEGKALVWCPNERLVVAKTHGEAFDEDGEVVGGPASRGLDEVPVEFERGYLDKAGPVERGAKASANGRAFDHEGPWDAGPGTFCEGMTQL